MYEPLKSRIEAQLVRPRALKGQTERQITDHLAEHEMDLPTFLREAVNVLAEHELDVLFAPQFTPSLDDQAELSDLLIEWQPQADDVQRLIGELDAAGLQGAVLLPDRTQAPLALHEVMIERHVRLLRLDQAPDAPIVARLQEVLADDLWPIAAALMRRRGMNDERQTWLARFVAHMAANRTIHSDLIIAIAEFMLEHASLEPAFLEQAAEAALRAAHGSAAFAEGGRTYWSPDVAQHHQYRGQGQIDQALVRQRQAQVEWLTAIAEDLATFDGPAKGRGD